MSSNSELGAMHTATTIVHDLNEGHAAKSIAEKTKASNGLRESFNQLLGPSVNHTSRDQVLKDVFKMDPAAEAKIHELLPGLQIVHDKNGQVNIDKTVTQLEKAAAHPAPAPDEQVNIDKTVTQLGKAAVHPVPAPDEQVNVDKTMTQLGKAAARPVPAPDEQVNVDKTANTAFDSYEKTNLPIAAATGKSNDIAFKTYEHTNLPIAPRGEIIEKDGSITVGVLNFAGPGFIPKTAPDPSVDFDVDRLSQYLRSYGLNSRQVEDLVFGFGTNDHMSRPNPPAHFDNMGRTPPAGAVETHDNDQVDLVPEADDND
jgi:hypothetical protein